MPAGIAFASCNHHWTPTNVQVDFVMGIVQKPENKDVKFVIFSKYLEPFRQLVDHIKDAGIAHGEITGMCYEQSSKLAGQIFIL